MIADRKLLCVYTHSVDGKVFYVGQGARLRPYAGGGQTCAWKSQAAAGYDVNIVHWTDNRNEAVRLESELIAAHPSACNIKKFDARPFFKRHIQAVTVRQVKAARELLAWTQGDLAETSGVSLGSIRRLEAEDGELRGIRETRAKIIAALRGAGIEFTNDENPGVRLRAPK